MATVMMSLDGLWPIKAWVYSADMFFGPMTCPKKITQQPDPYHEMLPGPTVGAPYS